MKHESIKVGQRLSYAIVSKVDISHSKNGKFKTTVYCMCDCGNKYECHGYRVKESCGCRMGNFKYGEYDKKVYSIWRSMKVRCLNIDKVKYKNHAGRGIKICERLLDFNEFQMVLGEIPSKSHSIDRENNNGHYSCGECMDCNKNGWGKNVRWATAKEQGSNKRNNHLVELDGTIVTLKEACRIKGLPYKQIHERIVRGGWDKSVAISTPINKSNRYKQNRNETAYRKKHTNI